MYTFPDSVPLHPGYDTKKAEIGTFWPVQQSGRRLWQSNRHLHSPNQEQPGMQMVQRFVVENMSGSTSSYSSQDYIKMPLIIVAN